MNNDTYDVLRWAFILILGTSWNTITSLKLLNDQNDYNILAFSVSLGITLFVILINLRIKMVEE